jgi:hypothetical protein
MFDLCSGAPGPFAAKFAETDTLVPDPGKTTDCAFCITARSNATPAIWSGDAARRPLPSGLPEGVRVHKLGLPEDFGSRDQLEV